MWPTLSLVVLFVAAMAVLPWLLRRLQGRVGGLRAGALGRGAAGLQPRVLGAVGVGPQQRVVTVEVGEGAQSVRLVLGVTAQNIQCLHVLQPAVGTFADAVARAQAGAVGNGSVSLEPGNV